MVRFDPSIQKTLDLEVREKRGRLDSTQQFCRRSIRPVNYENVRSRSSTKAKRFGFDPTFLKSIRFRCAASSIAPEVMKWERPTLLSPTTDVAGRFLFGVGGSGRRPRECVTLRVLNAPLGGQSTAARSSELASGAPGQGPHRPTGPRTSSPQSPAPSPELSKRHP